MPARKRDTLGKDAFYTHKAQAKARGIEFRFTYEGWRAWWETELGKLGPNAKRGPHRGDYGMCRHLDRGPYASENVYCGHPSQNKADHTAFVYRNLRVNDAALHGFGDTRPKRNLHR